jgi:hypothetical protein
MKTKEVRCVADVKNLLKAHEATLAQNGRKVIVAFPESELDNFDARKGGLQAYHVIDLADALEHAKPDKAKLISRTNRVGIRSLCSSGRFWRLTTCAHHLASYFRFHSEFGRVRTVKKAGEPFHIEFESDEYAAKFMAAVK